MSAVSNLQAYWCDSCVVDVVPGEVKMFGKNVTSIIVNVNLCVKLFA